jgi:hypothetical protein
MIASVSLRGIQFRGAMVPPATRAINQRKYHSEAGIATLRAGVIHHQDTKNTKYTKLFPFVSLCVL